MGDSTVYIVCGDAGEYSDHVAWYIKAFTDKEAADALCGRLNQWCKDHDCTDNSYRGKETPPEDPQFHSDYTGVTYCVMALPLEVAKDFNIRG